MYKLPIAPGGIALSREKPEKPAIIIGLLDPQRPCFYPYQKDGANEIGAFDGVHAC